MRNWRGKLESGYGYILLKSDTESEEVALNTLHPGPGFHLEIERVDEKDGCHRIEVVPDAEPQAEAKTEGKKKPGRKPSAYTSMSEPDLRTIAAERGVELNEGDKRGDIIRKLNQAE